MHPIELIERIKLLFRKDKELYSSFYHILGFYPRHIKHYKQALHHKSSSVKQEGTLINNERLEFLGDAILDAVVGDIVYRHFPGKREGFLTNTRSKIVQRESLNRLAAETGLDKLIISSTHNSSHNSYLGGNAFEAMVGAIYLDRGYDYCMRFVEKRILNSLINLDKVAYKEVNFKSKLIEWGQKRHMDIVFELVQQDKEDNSSPVFITQINIEGIACCRGRGYSKKESQQMAAKDTLALLRKSSETLKAIKERQQLRTQAKQDETVTPKAEDTTMQDTPKQATQPQTQDTAVEFDLSELSLSKAQPASKEDIVAAAEQLAFSE